jgi:histone H3/H4
MAKTIISKATAHNLLKKAGAERVSESASRELIKYLESYTKKLTEKAIFSALMKGKKTISKEDIKFAVKKLGTK